MTDKELLELAAKAAGYLETATVQNGYGFIGLVVMDEDGDWTGHNWNPLTDDGDALRLAVKLGFNMSCDTTEDNETTVIFNGGRFTCKKHKDDPYAATRRTIVRAAAEIGRTK